MIRPMHRLPAHLEIRQPRLNQLSRLLNSGLCIHCDSRCSLTSGELGLLWSFHNDSRRCEEVGFENIITYFFFFSWLPCVLAL